MKIIIDCDPGIDDAVALLLAAASPELELLAVTTVAGNRPVDTTTANARRVLDLSGATQVPVHRGCARPLAYAEPRCNTVHGLDGLGGWVGAAPQLSGLLSPTHAVDCLVDVLNSHPPGSITVVAVGPLTNLALAELRQPGVLARAAGLAIMGGAAFCPGNVTPAAEFNFYADALAAQLVLAAGAQVQLFGLDVTRQAAMTPVWVDALARLPGAAAQAAAHMLRRYGVADPLLHDACPVAWLLQPQLFKAQPQRVGVEWRDAAQEGRLLVAAAADAAASSVQLVVQLDTASLLALVHDRIATLH